MVESVGIRMTDPRLKECNESLTKIQREWDYTKHPSGVNLDRPTFKEYAMLNAKIKFKKRKMLC